MLSGQEKLIQTPENLVGINSKYLNKNGYTHHKNYIIFVSDGHNIIQYKPLLDTRKLGLLLPPYQTVRGSAESPKENVQNIENKQRHNRYRTK